MVKYNKHTHKALSIAITNEAMKELQRSARKLGISQKAFIELAIREKAEQVWVKREEVSE